MFNEGKEAKLWWICNMYVNFGQVGKAQKVLKGRLVQVVAYWNALILG